MLPRCDMSRSGLKRLCKIDREKFLGPCPVNLGQVLPLWPNMQYGTSLSNKAWNISILLMYNSICQERVLHGAYNSWSMTVIPCNSEPKNQLYQRIYRPRFLFVPSQQLRVQLIESVLTTRPGPQMSFSSLSELGVHVNCSKSRLQSFGDR